MTKRPANPPRHKDWENDISWEIIPVNLPFSDGQKKPVNIGKIERRHHAFILEISLCYDEYIGEYLYVSSKPAQGFRHHHPRQVERDFEKITGMRIYDRKGDVIEHLFDGEQTSLEDRK